MKRLIFENYNIFLKGRPYQNKNHSNDGSRMVGGVSRESQGGKPSGRVKKKREKPQPKITYQRAQSKPTWRARAGEKPGPMSRATTERPRAR